MIISEQWLREWIDTELDAQQVADCLTNAGLEVDAVSALSEPIDNLVIGKVLEVSKHPDADRLNLTKVDIGSEVLEIVCGAANVRQDLMVATATVGAKLPNGLKIKKAKVRGIESNGMLCSAAELGLEESSDGLLELASDAQIGQSVTDYLRLDDTLIDIDLTPNRGDCLSVQGVAREMKVLAAAGFNPVAIDEIKSSSSANISVEIKNTASCPRYLARVIENVDVSVVTPIWMQEKLRRCDIRPISPIVDITNYVMLELGQPMHAFDKDKIDTSIVVRDSKKGEKLALLDGQEITLDDDSLVIADNSAAIALAGVMGGNDSSINDNTQNIVLEAAHFSRAGIAGRARRYGLHTDSSHRFERGVDPELPEIAMQRASQLVLQICGGQAGEIIKAEDTENVSPNKQVQLRHQRLLSVLGIELEENEVTSILQRISDQVEKTEQGWLVTAPSYRFDVERECDLIEEVARVKGYDCVPTRMPQITPKSKITSEALLSLRSIRQLMVARDYQEAISYSFIDAESQALLSENKNIIQLTNPLADNMSEMRTSIWPGLLNAAKYNINRQQDRVRLFEIGAVYFRAENSENDEKFVEQQVIAGVVTGLQCAEQWAEQKRAVDFYDIKSDVEALLSLTKHQEAFIFNNLEHKALHPGQVAQINYNDQNVGYMGKLHPVVAKKIGLDSDTFVFELSLNELLQTDIPDFKGVSRFPAVKRDLAIIINTDVPANDVLQKVRLLHGSVLKEVVLFDVYSGKGVEEGKKSLALRVTLQSIDKTLTDDEVEQLIDNTLSALQNEFGAELRS